MNVLKRNILLGGCVAALTLCGSSNLMAQRGGGNFDPAQMRQNRIDRAHDALEVKDDTEWKAIEPLVGKVIDARTDYMRTAMAAMFGGGRNRQRNNPPADAGNTDQQPQRRNRGPFGGEPDAAMVALQKAIDDKAPASELKDKLAAVRSERKDKEAALKAAQDELKGVLTSRQEAIAVSTGLLD